MSGAGQQIPWRCRVGMLTLVLALAVVLVLRGTCAGEEPASHVTWEAFRWQAPTEGMTAWFSGQPPMVGHCYAFVVTTVSTTDKETTATMNFVEIPCPTVMPRLIPCSGDGVNVKIGGLEPACFAPEGDKESSKTERGASLPWLDCTSGCVQVTFKQWEDALCPLGPPSPAEKQADGTYSRSRLLTTTSQMCGKYVTWKEWWTAMPDDGGTFLRKIEEGE